MRGIERRLSHRNRPVSSRDLMGGRIAPPPHQLTYSRKPTSNRVNVCDPPKNKNVLSRQLGTTENRTTAPSGRVTEPGRTPSVVPCRTAPESAPVCRSRCRWRRVAAAALAGPDGDTPRRRRPPTAPDRPSPDTAASGNVRRQKIT